MKGWWPFRRYSGWGAGRAGRRDGKVCYPPMGVEVVRGYLGEMKNVAEENIQRIAIQWDALDHHLQQVVRDTEQNLQHQKQRLDEIKADQPQEHHHLSKMSQWLILAVMFLGEFPMNAIAFRLFGEAEVMTYLVTLPLALALLMCAHWAGATLKQPKRSKIELWGLTIAPLVAFLVILGVAFLREHYLTRMDEPIDHVITFAFIAIQLLIFVVATLITYAAEDKLRDQRDCVNVTSRELERCKARRETSFGRKQTEAHEIKHIAQRLMSRYEGENIPRRTDGMKNLPDVEINIPPKLKYLTTPAPVTPAPVTPAPAEPPSQLSADGESQPPNGVGDGSATMTDSGNRI